MPRLQIKHRWTGAILYEGEAETLGQLVATAVEKKINLGDADLGGANLGGADLGGANLGGAYLGGANLGGANLRGADLRDANLGDADLGGANLGGADLGGANLGGADLGGANLGGADLRGADLRGADLRGANLRGADLRGANLGDANLRGADLRGADHVFSFAGIGSARRNTTYWLEADKVWCGCFSGTLAEFVLQVEETHAEHPKFLAEYRAGISFLGACIEAIPEDEREAGRKAYAEMLAKPEPSPKGKD